MPERVINRGEISIAGEFYKLTRPVQSMLASMYPGKVVIGDVSGDSQQRLSIIRWDNARGGIGKKDHQEAVDVNRLWYGTSHIRVDGHRTLPSRPTTTAASGISGAFKVPVMGEINNIVHVVFGTSIRSYAPDTWSAELQAMSAPPTDAISCRLGGTVYLIFTNDANYYYTSNGTSYSTATDNIEYFACWDDRLWGIDSTGQLRWAHDPTGSWTDDAQLPLPNDYVQDLFVGRDAFNNHILYASTKVGLFAHDAGNERFVQTEMEMPFHDDSGKGVARWRDATHIPVGLGIYKYAIGGAAAVITTIGPDKDQGLPNDRRGKIIQLLDSHNDLIALVDNTAAVAVDTNTFVSSGMASHGPTVMGVATGRSVILAWDEIGWMVLWESGANEQPLEAAMVSGAYGAYRLWFAQNELVHYIDLPVDVVNPAELTDRVYADSSRDETPWFDAGQAEVDKIIKTLKVEVQDASANEHVTVYYGLDYDDDTWTQLTDAQCSQSTFDATDDRIEGNGVTTFTFASEASPTGTAFRAIRFRTDLANGSDNEKSPDVRSITMEFRKKVAAKFAWNVELDLTKPHKGVSPQTQRASLLTAMKSNTLVEFTFRSDTGDTRNFFTDIIQSTALEETGHDETGVTRLVVAQP